MKKFSKVAIVLLIVALLAMSAVLVACNKNTNSANQAGEEEGEDLGFTEVPIFENIQKEFLNFNAVYFQPRL